MIARDEVMPVLLEACPSYGARWSSYRADSDFQDDLLYIHLGDFACHVVDLLGRGELTEISAISAAVERLHTDGDPYVREAATIGLLEGIQNVGGNRDVVVDAFRNALGPEAQRWWASLDAFWDGKIPSVGSDIPKSSG